MRSGSERLRVVIADSEPVTRLGIRAALEQQAAVEVVGEAAEPAGAAELADLLAPAALVIAPGQEGVSMHLTAWDRLRALRAYVIAYLSTRSQSPAAALAGADSCLLKVDEPQLLCETLRRTVGGERLWLPNSDMPACHRDLGPGALERLVRQGKPTIREREVLAMLLERYSDAEIAERLFVSRDTVKSHVRNVLRKLCLPDRRALLHAAAVLGL